MACHLVSRSITSVLFNFQDGCNRTFKTQWLNDNSWLAYSAHLDAAFCVPCVLFAAPEKRFTLEALVNKPFNRWSRYTAVIKAHPGKEYHQSALLASKNFVTSVEKPETKITNILQEQKKSNIRENRAVLTHIIKAIVFLTKQGIALRGHDESAMQTVRTRVISWNS